MSANIIISLFDANRMSYFHMKIASIVDTFQSDTLLWPLQEFNEK